MTTVASVVTPAVVPTALMLQKTAIATAATVLAKSLPGDKKPFIISLTLQLEWNKQDLSLGTCADLGKLTEIPVEMKKKPRRRAGLSCGMKSARGSIKAS